MPKKATTTAAERRAATVNDIARALDVSAMTVSRALSGQGHVSEGTRARVKQKAEELGYRPNRWAQSLVTQRSRLMGLVVPDISHSFFAEITRGVQDVIEREGYNLLLCNTHRDAAAEVREVEALLAAHVDGLLVASDQPESAWRYYDRLVTEGVRLVMIDRYCDEVRCPHIGTDDLLAGRLVGEHLAGLGHRKIALIGGPAIRPARLRIDGCTAALTERGILICDAWRTAGDFDAEKSRAAARQLMSSAERPTAIFAANDNSAFGAVHGCRDAGLRVPEDVSVAGIGDVEGDLHPDPFLTTVRWDRMGMGQEAARMVLRAIGAQTRVPPVTSVFPPSLVARRSTAAPPSRPISRKSSAPRAPEARRRKRP